MLSHVHAQLFPPFVCGVKVKTSPPTRHHRACSSYSSSVGLQVARMPDYRRVLDEVILRSVLVVSRSNDAEAFAGTMNEFFLTVHVMEAKGADTCMLCVEPRHSRPTLLSLIVWFALASLQCRGHSVGFTCGRLLFASVPFV